MHAIPLFVLFAQAGDNRAATPFSYQNVVDGDALGISILGMLIVFSALVLISFFISSLPKLLTALEAHLPPPHTDTHHHHQEKTVQSFPSSDPKIVAAIGFVLNAELQKMTRD